MSYRPILFFAALCWVLMQMQAHITLASVAFLLLPFACLLVLPVLVIVWLIRHLIRRRATLTDTLLRKRVP